MNIVFRVDSSSLIGVGHLVRTLVLARILRLKGATCFFICRAHAGHRTDLINNSDFAVHILPMTATAPVFLAGDYASWLGASVNADAIETATLLKRSIDSKPDWLVVDHYGASAEWQRTLRKHCRYLMVIDDHALGIHDCDVLLNQSVVETESISSHHSKARVGRTLLGPQFSLLAPEFSQAWIKKKIRNLPVKRVLVAFGGADLPELTLLATNACLAIWPQAYVDVVLGSVSYQRGELDELVRNDPRVHLHVAVQDVCSLMLSADFAVGAAGMMSWERCATGLPAALVALVDNQKLILEYLLSKGAAVRLEQAHFMNIELLVAALQDHLLLSDNLADMSKAALEITDGQGAIRVAKAMGEFK